MAPDCLVRWYFQTRVLPHVIMQILDFSGLSAFYFPPDAFKPVELEDESSPSPPQRKTVLISSHLRDKPWLAYLAGLELAELRRRFSQ